LQEALLTKDHDGFHAEKAAIKQAGLETARWISEWARLFPGGVRVRTDFNGTVHVTGG
jgi:hypothetical protein